MRVKPRLAALADCVPGGAIVADIGTDHAILPVYLVKSGRAGKVIAVENNPSTLAGAKRSLDSSNSRDQIELRLGDGMGPLRREDGVGCVVIAGLGGRTICRILLAAREKWEWLQSLVLQPMQESSLLRRWLVAHGMLISSEKLAREGNKIYEIMVARRGKQKIFNPLLFELGPCLLRDKDPLLATFVEQKIHRCRSIVDSLAQSTLQASKIKRAYFLEKEASLKEVLALVRHSAADRRLH